MLHSSPNNSGTPGKPAAVQKLEEFTLTEIDHVAPNAKLSRHNAWLYIFDDNEAVTNMIIHGPSPTMRHVSRTDRVARDWLFDRIKLDPMIQIKYVDTRSQIADILTKGTFTRDEWKQLLWLFNIMDVSSFTCSHSGFRTEESSAMSKRTDAFSEDRKIASCAKHGRMGTQPVVSTVWFNSSSVPVPEDLGSERLGAKTTGRDLALGHVTGSVENRVFYFKTIRKKRRKFDVSDGFLCQFSVNEAFWGRLMNSLCRQSCTWTGMEIRANVFFETWMWTRSKMYSP